jgi:DinB family protein
METLMMRPMVRTLVVGGAIALLPLAAAAQENKPVANPVMDGARQLLAQYSKNLVASAELMPAEKYSYHPTESQMTFGQLIVHIAQTNSFICSGIGDLPTPDVFKLAATESKETLVAAIKQSFALCVDALGKTDDTKLGEDVSMMGKRTGQTRARAVLTIAVDWADHYSTAASYLRMNNILPPSAPPKK